MDATAGRWERLAAFEGGTVSWLASAPAADGTQHVFAATPVGVFRSLDLGLTWSPLDPSSAVAGVEVVAASPGYANDGIVFVGAREGLFRWQEGTAGWTHLLASARVLSLIVRQGDDARMTLLAGTEDDGILVSRDGGRTWTGANPGLLDLTILALAVSPDFEQDGLAFAATTTGLYRTRNGGESWRIIELDWDDVAVQCLALSPDFAEDRVLLAGTEDHGLLRSDDAGRSWEQVPELASLMVNSLSFGAAGRVVAGTDGGLALSEDGGQTWRRIGEDLGGIAGALSCEGGPGAVLLAGLPESGAPNVPGLPHTGIARSEDAGQTWVATNDGLTARLAVGLALSPTFEQDQTMYVVSLDMGVSVSRDGGLTWDVLDEDLEGEPANLIAVGRSSAGEQLVVVSTERGPGLSRDGGATWSTTLSDQLPQPARALALVTEATAATILLAPSDEHLILSSDSGATWQRLTMPPGSGQVVGLALSPTVSQDSTFYLATAAGAGVATALTLWRTTDRGRHWDRWLELPGAPNGGAVQVVALPQNRWDDTLVLGLGARLFRPRLNAWEVSAGRRRPVWDAVDVSDQEPLGRSAAITGLAVSPAYATDRTLYAATSTGVYVSREGGASFDVWSEGLEPASIVGVAPSPAYARDRLVYALGLGGSIWWRRDA